MGEKRPRRPETLAAQGVRPPAPEELPPGLRGRPHTPPIQVSTTYDFEDLAASLRPLTGREGYAYARYGNPNGRELELTMAALEGAEDAVATSSGLAAVTATVLAFAGAGDRVLVQQDAYGGTLALLRQDLARLGLRVDTVDAYDHAAVAAALDEDAALLLVESVSNPLLRRADVGALAQACAEGGTRLVVDATFSTPVLATPLRDGADVVLHSGTKFLGGHHDVTLGVVSGSAADMERVRRTAVHVGARVPPFDAWLCTRGLRTLALRVERACANAEVLAARLRAHPAVETVRHPGACALVTFDVGSRDAAFAVAGALRLIAVAPSLGGVTSTLSHPATASHAALAAAERAALGIGDGLLRLAVGIEHADDLWDELRQALDAASGTRRNPSS